jgi:hypothetical protein
LRENANSSAARARSSGGARETKRPRFPKLRTEWTQFGRSDQTLCIGTTTTGGFASYVELLTCLEKAHDLVTANHDPDPHAKSAAWPTQSGRPGITVGEGHGQVRLFG